MKRLAACLLVAACALIATPAGYAGDDDRPKGKRNALELSVVSSPAHLVSGGDARIEVAVPASVPLSAVTVTLNGTNVTSAFAADPEGNHQLEGVVTGLPLGRSELVARAAGPGKSRRHRDSLTLTNHDIQGPMFSGPRQVPFVCATPNNAGGFGLPTIAQSETCETATVVSFRYRSTTNQWLDYNPASPPAPSTIQQVTTLDGETVPLIIRWERGVINRFMYSIAMLSPASQGPAPDFSAWNGKLLYSFSGGVAIGRTQGAASSGDMLHLAGLGLGYAVIYSSGNRTNTHYNLQLGGETAIMVKDRFVSALRRARVHDRRRRLRRRHPAVRLRPEPRGSARRRRAAVLVLGHGHADDPRRRLRAARALGGLQGHRRPALDVEDLGQPVPHRRAQHLRDVAEPVRPVDAVHADARLERVHQRLARALAARAQPALRHGARATTSPSTVPSSGRTGPTS